MVKKDKNEERKERILNLTLEIIYLLTGEGYVIPKKKSPTVGLGALHAPGSVIQKENDKKILELISNIIQLLTGEVGCFHLFFLGGVGVYKRKQGPLQGRDKGGGAPAASPTG
uniref:Uncharacterized protein n=1 Tax=Xenopus tropicalis TaxID=8364 RepID=A0A1B8XTD1_XENTR